MKKLYILAALLLATTSAHAGGISFQIEGQRVRIEAPRGCASLSCINITAPGFKGLKSNRYDDDDDVAPAPARPEYSDSKRYNDDYAPAAGKPRYNGYQPKRYNDDDYAAAPPRQDRPPAPAPDQAAAPAPAPAPAPTTYAAAPPQTDVAPPAPAPAAEPAPARYSAPAPAPAPVDAGPASDPNSPIGVWATEENKGNVRIEQCGDNLCGYAVKTGEKILINMKPQGSKWAGRINDPDSGRKYDSTMSMKSNGSLRVQGCAFGGMFCGGQTWKRVS
ncbi:MULTISPECIES: DUF2147 domain-containing protein [unclassified Bradyrhizobium]|uniref:DUF2147 domain-containing protein n=1 Tax=unclassified Bradyrhizobium TaxID=2631580 RepID=UPI001BA5253C|nr:MULTISPECIES: DUF2147 domain-containing protein [unclassified Bradyrhizobium]MBR1228249.1 DUF2147 domain-containing protein [Bradyrhizobium sp. AUGA SZCCT0176]MBR1299304.1 DUF2147 domain-containing protein [Bradyrhizobium sp. AUGA SZCCT0042]